MEVTKQIKKFFNKYNSKEKILVTGGLGYIGSHTVVELIEAGYEIFIVDNLVNSNIEVLNGIKEITGVKPVFENIDCTDYVAMDRFFSKHEGIKAIIHFAALKAVGESVSNPIMYYENNIGITINLLKSMEANNVRSLVFSSSATVYHHSNISPLDENMRLGAENPYGFSKLMIEQILKDLYSSDNSWSIVILRYFNPTGCHKTSLIGESPKGKPNNLMPYIAKVASGELDILNIFGSDYDTPDGTGIRDYIHVVDLAIGHILALEKLNSIPGVHIFNLGTGTGYSVLEVVKTFEKINKVKVPYKITRRRPGDLAVSFADSSKAEKVLGFKAERSLSDMVRDSWNFQKSI